MDYQQFSLKELYQVSLKANYELEINGQKFYPGDVITTFDHIQLANFGEIRQFVAARGGFDNRAQVTWDTVQEVPLSFIQGVFSREQMAVMNNLRLVSQENSNLTLTQTEYCESDENGIIILRHEPLTNLHVRAVDGQAISYTIDKNELTLNRHYCNCIVSYNFEYKNPITNLIVGERFLNGFLSLEGRTRFKDDKTGANHTGIIQIPKLKIVSKFSLQLGENAAPVNGSFDAIAYPVGPRGNVRIVDLWLLNEDIDADF